MDKFGIGIDIGGTTIKVGLVQNGEIIHKTNAPSPRGEVAVFLNTVYGLIDEVLTQSNTNLSQIDRIGIGVAGMVKDGVLLYASNLKLENVNLKEIFEQKYGVPVAVANDVACFALAQKQAHKLTSLVYLAIGTGINAGVIASGVLLDGIEYGHTALLDATVEDYISIRGRENYGTQKLLAALDVVLVNVANTYRPQKIFLGGGIALSLAPYIDQINKRFQDNHYGYKNAPAIPVEISTLSTDGGILGAVLNFARGY